MEQTKHGMTKYTKNEDYLHTDHFNSIVENVEKLYDETEKSNTELLEKLKEFKESFDSHLNNKENPHGVTAEQIGLGNVNNTSDEDKPVSDAQRKAIQNIGNEAKNYTDQCLISVNNHINNPTIHHDHSNKAVLDTITQEMLDDFASSGGSGSSDEIVLGNKIDIQIPTLRGLVGSVEYDTKKYGSLTPNGFFFIPHPLLYIDEDITGSADEPLFYSQKLVDLSGTPMENESEPFSFAKGELVWLRGRIGSSGRLFQITNISPITQAIPSMQDAFDYMLLGQAASSTEIYLFQEHPVYRCLGNTFKDITIQNKMKVIDGIQFNPITNFVENTDEYRAQYPYCCDLWIGEITESTWVEVNFKPVSLELECLGPQANSLEGCIRIYATELPSENIEIDNIVYVQPELW